MESSTFAVFQAFWSLGETATDDSSMEAGPSFPDEDPSREATSSRPAD
jgi:hypothetical protein